MKKRKRFVLLAVLGIIGSYFIGDISITASVGLADRLMGKFKEVYKPIEPLIPPDVTVKPGFKVGKGPVIGNIQMVQGEGLVIHKGESAAYKLKKDYPLFTGDMLVAKERSRLNARMHDKSVFALAPNSKMVIDKSIYDPEKNERSSLLGLLFGRARFIVAKISGKPNYTIKTPTAVCGVRGSDFALAVSPNADKTSSLQNYFSSLNLTKEALAAPQAGALLTAVVTGPGTTVSFGGTIGVVQIVGPVSVCSAAAGASAISPIVVGAAAAGAALGAVGPGLAALSMPPGF